MGSLTVIIATCGRPERLVRVLGCLRACAETLGATVPVIVADNHPQLSARRLTEGFDSGGRLQVKWIETPPFNKAAALNAAIRAAQTEWLAFTDDDTLPDPDWLREGLSCLQHAGWRVMGGRVTPGPDPANLPRWLRPGRTGRVPGIGVHVCYEPLAASGLLSRGTTAPFGANLFVHKDVFRQHGGYDEDLWRLCEKKWPLGSEDSEFGHRLKLRGEPIGYCRAALVVHPVNEDRASLSLHLRRAFCEGWRQPLVFSEERRAWFEPFRARVLMRHFGGMFADVMHRDTAGAADHLVEFARTAGSIVGRWSAAYPARRAGQQTAHAHRIVHQH
jgi:GT2 family glycosyltransferase